MSDMHAPVCGEFIHHVNHNYAHHMLFIYNVAIIVSSFIKRICPVSCRIA